MKKYYAILAQSNLKGDDDKYRYYIEPVDGGGIEAAVDTELEAHEWCKDNNGTLKYII